MISGQQSPWWQRRSCLAALIILFALPFAIGDFPPLIDLPAHMARYHVGANLAESRDLARYFTFAWRFLPNLGVDLPVIALAPLIGVEPATRLVVSLIPALAAAGMLGIARAAHGRLPATAFFALPLAFAYPMIFGFVNACLAVALAFVAFGLWLHLDGQRHTGAAALLAAIAAPIILTAHIVGYGVFGLTLLGASLGRAIESRTPWPRAIRDTAFACLPAAWPFLILLLWRTGTAPPTSGWLDWHTKASWLGGLLRDHSAPFDIASAALVYLVMLLPLIRPARFTYAPRIAVPGLILWILALGLPTTLITQFASVRLIYIACALTVLAVRPRGETPLWLPLAGLAFVALRLLSVSWSTLNAHRTYDRELAALDHIARGSRVIALEAMDCDRHWQPARLTHLPSMATVRRDAFVNDQFVTSEGQLMGLNPARPTLKAWLNPIVFASPCARWDVRPTIGQALATLPWRDMDYLWLIDVPAELRPSDARLKPEWQAGNSILYRVQ